MPHELGLLEGVKTYFVPDSHPNLCKNDAVLGAIGELLRTGVTGTLTDHAPAPADGWIPGTSPGMTQGDASVCV